MKQWTNWGYALTLLAIFIIALFTRLYDLEAIPLGINYDVASKGVHVLNILYENARPFFVNHFGVPEPLILYVQSLSVALFGANVFALRVVTGIANVLAVIFLFALARDLTRDRRVALIAALAFAISLELMHDARGGSRYALVPLFEIAMLWFFARGWRDGRARDFIVAGVILGLALYAYIAALMLPGIIIVLIAHQWLVAREQWRARIRPSLLALLVGGIIALPRVIFTAMYPATALTRTSQVGIWQNPDVQTLGFLQVVLRQLLGYVKMFGVEWQGATFGQPLFDPFLFALFLVGAIVCLARWKQIEWVWAPLTMVVMFLPDLLGANEATPNKLRTIGVFAPAFFLVGVGATWLLTRVERFARARWIIYTALIMIFAASAWRTFDLYFIQRIANSSKSQEWNGFNTSPIQVAEARWIIAQIEPILLPLNEYANSPMRYLIGARAPRLRSALRVDGTIAPDAMPTRTWVVIPTDTTLPRTEGRAYVHDPQSYAMINRDTVFILPPTRADAPTIEMRLRGRVGQPIRDWSGATVANAYAMDLTAEPIAFVALPKPSPAIEFAQDIALVGSSIETLRAKPGETITFSLFWRAQKTMSQDFALFAHLIDAKEEIAANADVIPALGAYSTFLWKPDEVIPTHHQIKIPARTRPAKYRIEIGLTNILDGNRLDVLDARGVSLDSRVILGAVKIAPATPLMDTPRESQSANFDQRIALLGYTLPTRSVKPGESVTLSLYWQARAEMDRDYTVFVHMLDADGNIVAQSDHQPQAGNYPTSIWDAGERVRDEFALNLPNDLANGKYQIKIGWYDLETGARLSARDASDQILGDHILLDAALEVAR